MLLAGRTEGLLLDPVYTGKAFAGFLDLVRRGSVGPEPVVFMHTGGTPALFAYGPDRPGTLSAQTYRDILAFVLSTNSYPTGAQELRADDLDHILVAVNPDPHR